MGHCNIGIERKTSNRPLREAAAHLMNGQIQKTFFLKENPEPRSIAMRSSSSSGRAGGLGK